MDLRVLLLAMGVFGMPSSQVKENMLGGGAFGVCFGFLFWRFDAKKMNGKTIFLSCTFGDGLNSLCVGVATFIYSRIESISQTAVESGVFFSV